MAETDAEITIEEKISAGITDSRTIKKSDVASVTKDAPDELAWIPLKNYKIGANSLPLASYDAVINPLSFFQTQYPQSPHAAEAKKIGDDFAAEKKRVTSGEVKLDGKWLSKEEAQKEQYQINALLAFNYMKDQSTRDLTGALNTFDALEKNYPGARVYPDAVELAKRVLPALKGELDRRAQIVAATKADREKGLQLASPAQKTEFANIIKREDAALDAALDAAQKQSLKWPPLVNSTRAVQDIGGKIAPELQRLSALPTAKMRESLQATDKARAALAKKDLEAADAALTAATNAWSANEFAIRLRDEIAAAKSTTSAAPAVVETAPVVVPPKTEHPSETASAPEADEPEPEKSFFLTPAGAIVAVLGLGLLFGAWTVYRKISGKANEIIQ